MDGKIALILRASDVENAEKILKANGVAILSLEEIKNTSNKFAFYSTWNIIIPPLCKGSMFRAIVNSNKFLEKGKILAGENCKSSPTANHSFNTS